MRSMIIVAALSLVCQGALAMEKASGTFSVKMDPQEEAPSEGVTLGRMLLTKSFAGDLIGEASGQMLTAVSKVASSAVYVAAEKFEGALNGRAGSFAMTRRGVMADGEQDLTIEIVPDTGTGELTGISGSMSIDIRDGTHFYTLDYEITQ